MTPQDNQSKSKLKEEYYEVEKILDPTIGE
jgi:hypothetical protein